MQMVMSVGLLDYIIVTPDSTPLYLTKVAEYGGRIGKGRPRVREIGSSAPDRVKLMNYNIDTGHFLACQWCNAMTSQ